MNTALKEQCYEFQNLLTKLITFTDLCQAIPAMIHHHSLSHLSSLFCMKLALTYLRVLPVMPTGKQSKYSLLYALAVTIRQSVFDLVPP